MDPGHGLVSPDWSRIDDSAIRHRIAELVFVTIRQTHPAVKQCDKAALSLRPISPLAFFITESRLSCVRNITQGTGAAVWSQTTPARHRSLSVWVEIDHSSAAKRLGVTVSQDISLSSPHPPFFQPNGAPSSNATHLSGDQEPVIIVINKRGPKLQGQAAWSSFWRFTSRLRVPYFCSDSRKWQLIGS